MVAKAESPIGVERFSDPSPFRLSRLGNHKQQTCYKCKETRLGPDRPPAEMSRAKRDMHQRRRWIGSRPLDPLLHRFKGLVSISGDGNLSRAIFPIR
jgi:hypothetical protein